VNTTAFDAQSDTQVDAGPFGVGRCAVSTQVIAGDNAQLFQHRPSRTPGRARNDRRRRIAVAGTARRLGRFAISWVLNTESML
jgi:hypothetical protein